MSIKNKLALLVSLLFGVLLCVAAALLIQSSEARLRESIIVQNTALIKALTSNFDERVLARHRMLINVASRLSPETLANPAELQTFIDRQFVLHALFTNLLTYDTEGTVLAASPEPEKYVGSKRMARMEYVVRTLEDHQPYISKLFKSPVSGLPLIVMTAPVLGNDGKIAALLGGSQYILSDNLFSNFTQTHIGRTGNLFLASRDRTLISHPDRSRLMEQLPAGASPGIDQALTAGRFAGEVVTTRGVPALMIVDTMKTTGWLVGMVLPLQEAYAPITAMRAQGFTLLVVLLLVLPLLVWFGASYMMRPLLLLRDHIRAMARSSQAHALIASDRRDEIGELARAFDGLTLARQAAEAELTFLAHHDPLTKLPNRLLLRDRFERATAEADRNNTRIAMLFLDLDNFKEVNDSLGHGVGDELLVCVVQRLQAALRKADTISREGGDEFAVLISGVKSISDVGHVAQTILDAMMHPFEINDHTLHASCSIGISVYPNDGEDFDTMRKNADTALYQAKDSGRRNYRFFAGHMNLDAQLRMQMQMDLRRALKKQEFELFYQPQISLRSAHVVGVEALIRWRRNGELVPPSEFIPIAEQNGLIIPISEWVIGEACRQGAEWRRQGLTSLVIAVNLSALQFKHGNITDTVRLALENSGLPPEALELELTESILLQDMDAAMNTLHELKALGVHLSIDDFGTGYSSLSYLKRLPVDRLKIDRSFVGDVVRDADAAAIVKAIIQLGHTLQLEVTAEGVETGGQYDFLKESGCDEAQGYLFSKPIVAVDIPDVVVSLGMNGTGLADIRKKAG